MQDTITGAPVVAEKFSETFTVARQNTECWEVLTDANRIAGWVAVISDVEEHKRLSAYSAVLADRLGPFQMKADLDVAVTSLEEHTHISIRVDGEDRQIGSRITVEATMDLEPVNEGCVVHIDGAYEITGRAATIGGSTIRQKAKKILAEFTAAARRDLA